LDEVVDIGSQTRPRLFERVPHRRILFHLLLPVFDRVHGVSLEIAKQLNIVASRGIVQDLIASAASIDSLSLLRGCLEIVERGPESGRIQGLRAVRFRGTFDVDARSPFGA